MKAWLSARPMLSGLFGGGFAVLVVAMLFVVGFLTMDRLLDESPYFKKREALCNHYVALLAQSPEAVEVLRAGVIVREMDCNLTRRLKLPAGAP